MCGASIAALGLLSCRNQRTAVYGLYSSSLSAKDDSYVLTRGGPRYFDDSLSDAPKAALGTGTCEPVQSVLCLLLVTGTTIYEEDNSVVESGT